MMPSTVGGVIVIFSLIAVVSCEVKVLLTSSQCQCETVSAPACQYHFNIDNWYGRFPNARGQDMNQAVTEFVDFFHLLTLDNYCSHMLYNLLCFHYFPKCEKNRPELGATPCRETCNEAMNACAEHVTALPGYRFPVHLNCSNFPPRSSDCSSVGPPQDNSCSAKCITACPNASIHVEFVKNDEDQTIFRGSELNRSVEVCLRLANVGSYAPKDTLQEAVEVKLNGSDHAGATFQSKVLTFQNDSEKGKVLCTFLDMVRYEGERTADKFVRVFATVLTPVETKIGGAAASRRDSIALKLQHTECPEFEVSQIGVPRERLIPPNHCGRLRCNWRTNISRNTLTNNQYSFIARVQVLGCRSSMLQVHMLECHNLTCGACPGQMPACLTVSICPNCQLEGCMVGKEVIIAGKISPGGQLFIGNSRKSGLFYDQPLEIEDFIPPSYEP